MALLPASVSRSHLSSAATRSRLTLQKTNPQAASLLHSSYQYSSSSASAALIRPAGPSARSPAGAPSHLAPLAFARRISSSSSNNNNETIAAAEQGSSSTSSPTPSSPLLQTFHTRQGRVRIDLSKPSLIGVYQSRGERPYQEDACQVQSLPLDAGEVQRSLSELDKGIRYNAKAAGAGDAPPVEAMNGSAHRQDATTTAVTEQGVYLGVFDGHNGSSVSTFLKDNLHSRILAAERSKLNDTVEEYRGLGGYLRRYRGGILSDLVDEPAGRRRLRGRSSQGKAAEEAAKSSEEGNAAKTAKVPWNLHQRIHAAHLSSDLEIIGTEKEAGSVSTTCFLHSLDEPRMPFYSSSLLHLVVAHLGDTRALICSVPDGTASPLTETHHPEARSETERLMKTRTGAVTDSFGESRWAGTLANTRGFGDYHYKALGVFAEPAVRSHVLRGEDTAFVVLMSDGVTDMLSDQEIVDLIRFEKSPGVAAKSVVNFAESIGAQDNLTCIVVPLAGWGRTTAEDSTKSRRQFRLENYGDRSHRQNRM